MNLSRNLPLMTGMALLQGMVFYSPVATLYRVQNGLSLSEFFLIEALSWLLTLLSEVPWGLVADRVGARRTLLWGHGLFLVTKVLFALASGFGGFLAERLLLALALGALSGCDSALVHRSSAPGTAARAFARLQSAGLAGLVVAALVGPWLASYSLRWTAWATVVPYSLAWVLAWFLRDASSPVSRPVVWRREARKMTLALGRLFARGWAWPLSLAALTLVAEVSHLVLIFLSQLLYQRAGIPPGVFGVLFLCLQLVPMGVLALVPPEFGRNPRRWLIGLAWGTTVLLGILAFQTQAAVTIGALVLLAVVAQAQAPLSSTWQNLRVRGGSRATTLSVYALWSEVVSAGTNGILGGLGGEVTTLALVAAGLTGGAAAVLMWCREKA